MDKKEKSYGGDDDGPSFDINELRKLREDRLEFEKERQRFQQEKVQAIERHNSTMNELEDQLKMMFSKEEEMKKREGLLSLLKLTLDEKECRVAATAHELDQKEELLRERESNEEFLTVRNLMEGEELEETEKKLIQKEEELDLRELITHEKEKETYNVPWTKLEGVHGRVYQELTAILQIVSKGYNEMYVKMTKDAHLMVGVSEDGGVGVKQVLEVPGKILQNI